VSETPLHPPEPARALSAFSRFLGFTIDHAEPGHAVMRCRFRPEFSNMAMVAHGGVVTALMDTACGVALTTDPDGVRRTRFVTVSFSLNFLAPFRDGEVTCEARVVGGGRKLKTVETRVIGPDGETLLATGHGVFRRIQ
jgi:acyl-CoA thioesterase